MEISLTTALVGACGVIGAALITYLAQWQKDYLARLAKCEDRITVLERENTDLRSSKLALERQLVEKDRQIAELQDEVRDLKEHIRRIETITPAP